MPLPAVEYIGNMDTLNPVGTDSRTISDDTHRNVAESVRQTLPFLTGEVTANHLDINLLTGIQAAGSKLMIGQGGATVIVFYNPTVPNGWTFLQPDTNVRQLLIGPDAGGAVIGGSDDPKTFSASVNTTVSVTSSGATANHTLTIAEIPAHSHEMIMDENGTADSQYPRAAADPLAAVSSPAGVSIQETGGDGAHNHGIASLAGSGTGTGNTSNITPRYAQCVLGQLNA